MNNGKSIDTIIPAISLLYSNSANNIYINDNVNLYVNNNNNKIINTKNKKNKNIITSATYYHFPQNLPNTETDLFAHNGKSDNCLTLVEETLLLKKNIVGNSNTNTKSNSNSKVNRIAATTRSETIINANIHSNMGLLMHKSNSYNDGIMFKPKMTIIKQNEYDDRFNTSIHYNDDDNDGFNDYDIIVLPKASISMPTFCTRQLPIVNKYDNVVATSEEEHETFLNYHEIHETNNDNAVNSVIAELAIPGATKISSSEATATTTTTTTTTTTIEAQTTNIASSAATAAAATAAAATTISLFNINNRRYNRVHRNNDNNRNNKKSQRYAICYRLHDFIAQYNLYLNYLVPFFLLIGLMFIAYLTRDYAKRLLYWIELQNHWIIFFMFMILFIIVSFPIVVGYFVLMITAGYLFGFTKGLITVILGANLGIFIAHLTLRNIRHRIPIQKIIKNETGRAILRVISGPRAFRVVLFTRLTPIPFGLQNTIFGISSINTRLYHVATFLGLLPAQIINIYLGSTLRSMHEVLNNQGTALTGYISFAIEVICGIALMCWVVRKARKELSNTLLTNLNNDNRLIDIQV